MIQHFPSLALFLQIRSSRFLLAVLHRLSFVHLYAVACILEKWFFQVELFQRKWQDTHPFALHYLPVSSLPSLLKLSSFDWSFWPQIFGSIRRTSAKVSARIWAPGSRDGDLVRTFGDTSRSEDADAAFSLLKSQTLQMSKFSALNRRYLRISKNTTLEVRIYLHPDLIPTFTVELLQVWIPRISIVNS